MKPTLNASGRLEDGGHDRGKPLEVAKACYLATISLSIGRFVFILNISEFKVQLTRTTPPIIG